MGIQETLFEKLMDSDRKGANEVLMQWIASDDYNDLLVDVLAPVLRHLGEMWASEEFSLAHSYVASKVIEDAFQNAILEKGLDSDAFTKGPVVLGNIEDDCHPLGRRIVSAFLKANGWIVHDLGIDVDAETFVDKAVETGAKIIGVSAMIFTTAENIRHLRALLDERGLSGRIQMAVGGAVFRLRPELVKAVGGDGSAPDAVNVPALFDTLWAQAENAELEERVKP